MKRYLKKGILLGLFCSLILLGSFNCSRDVNDKKRTIVATITIEQGYKAEVLQAIEAVVEGTRKEPGNIFYYVYEDVDNPLKFVFIETWKSQEAIDFHIETAHFKDFIKAVDGKATLEASILKQRF